MIRWLLGLFGYEIVYVARWVAGGAAYEVTYASRYDALDAQMGRPIHSDMRVAPPWAEMRIRRAGTN